MTFTAAPASFGTWADTSETLILAQYQKLALLGIRGAIRYVPNASQSPAVGIQLGELQAALSVRCPDGAPFGMQFVQFARSSNVNATTGDEDGRAGAEYMKALGVPASVCLWQDLDLALKADAIAYSNASFAAMVNAYLLASAPGCYCEPGYPLTASERYSLLDLHRYWATAAEDPNRFVAQRGVQIIQSWDSSRGEYSPIPGVEIDGDAMQQDYFGARAVCVISP